VDPPGRTHSLRSGPDTTNRSQPPRARQLAAFVELHIQAERSTELRDYLSEIYNEGRAAVARMVHAALGDVHSAVKMSLYRLDLARD
jgi:hypothetical protein